jgi:hypothetical protein
VKAPDKARIDVDEKEEPATKIRLVPGAHKVTVTTDGAPQTQSFNIGAGESRTLDFLTPPPPKQEDTKPSPLVRKNQEEADASNGPPTATWVCFGVGAAAAGVGTFFGVKTLQAKTNFDTNPTPAFRDDFNSARLSTDVAIGVSAAAFAIGLVLWFTAASHSDQSDGPKKNASSYRWGTW